MAGSAAVRVGGSTRSSGNPPASRARDRMPRQGKGREAGRKGSASWAEDGRPPPALRPTVGILVKIQTRTAAQTDGGPAPALSPAESRFPTGAFLADRGLPVWQISQASSCAG